MRAKAGLIGVAPFDAAARRAAEECAAALCDAGHLATLSESATLLLEEFAWSDREVAVIALTDGEGVRLAESGETARRLSEMVGRHRETTLVVLLGVQDGAASRAAIRAGAFATAPGLPSIAASDCAFDDAIDLALLVARALQREARPDPGEADLVRLIGHGSGMEAVHRLARRATESSSPVLVIGEAGSGKHLVARAIHAGGRGRRHAGPFVKLPLGAFAGMNLDRVREVICGTAARPGPVELASGGTLFLDDVGRLPKELQAMMIDLLDAGEEGTVPLADGTGTVAADIRLVAGAPGTLEEDAERGTLRMDLYYRLRVLPINLPPLRDRLTDLPLLVDALLERYAPIRRAVRPGRAARNAHPVIGLTPRAVALLQRYNWPGNLRELDDHTRRAMLRAVGPVLDEADFPELSSLTAGRPPRKHQGTIDIELALDESLPLAEAGRRAGAVAEIVAIRRALKLSGGNVTQAARSLKVSRVHLQARMKRYALREEH